MTRGGLCDGRGPFWVSGHCRCKTWDAAWQHQKVSIIMFWPVRIFVDVETAFFGVDAA